MSEAALAGDVSNDLATVAVIFSRPELECFVSALRAEGILASKVGDEDGRTQQLIVALGGYRVRVPATQLDHATALIAELHAESGPLKGSISMPRRLWWLVAILALSGVVQAFAATRMADSEAPWPLALLGALAVASFPFPIAMPGDYRDKYGRLIQTR